jgi:hypothetical protein
MIMMVMMVIFDSLRGREPRWLHNARVDIRNSLSTGLGVRNSEH